MDNKILTVDIGASKIRIQVVDEDGDFGKEEVVSIMNLKFDNKKFIELLVQKISPHIRGDNNINISAICVGVPGSVNPETKVVRRMANVRGVARLDIIGELGKFFKLPVFILNDGDAGALGEWWLGSGRGFKNLLYLTLGTGVGNGMIEDNRLKSHLELGHTKLEIDAKKQICGCGEINHVESYFGTGGLAYIYAEVFGINTDSISPAEKYSISPKMREGTMIDEKKWIQVQEKYSEYLAVFLKRIIEEISPEAVVLGGGVIFDNSNLLSSIQNKMRNIKILPARFENSVNLGLAKYAFDAMHQLL